MRWQETGKRQYHTYKIATSRAELANNDKEHQTTEQTVQKSNFSDGMVFKWKIAKFVIAYNVPLSSSDGLANLVKKLSQLIHAKVSPSVTANRDSTTRFAGAITKVSKENHLRVLENQRFSIAMDCGTTSSNQEFLAISARYLQAEDSTKTTTKLLGLLPIKESSTGELIAKTISEFLFQVNSVKRERRILLE